MRTVFALVALLSGFPIVAAAQTKSLQDVSTGFASLPSITIYPAREVVTLDPAKPKADAVAVVGTIHEGRVFAVKHAGKTTVGARLPVECKPVAGIPVHSEKESSHHRGGCCCSVNRQFVQVFTTSTR